MPDPASVDIDRILATIQTEASTRGARGADAFAAATPPSAVAAAIATAHGAPRLEVTHASDLLALPLDVFIAEAYQQVLGRMPDAGGAAHYQRALLRGSLTRMEVLGRLAYSPEGRRGGRMPPGVLAGFILATCYRIPVVGPLLGLAARLLRLPAHCQDRSAIEAAAAAAGSWMKR